LLLLVNAASLLLWWKKLSFSIVALVATYDNKICLPIISEDGDVETGSQLKVAWFS